jgi:hypothetical protein
MITVDIAQLRDDAEALVNTASHEDVAVTIGGKVRAILTRPHEIPGRREYMREREQRLASIKLIGDEEWDSAKIISEDRDGR